MRELEITFQITPIESLGATTIDTSIGASLLGEVRRAR
jgi:hypothetical protein